MRTLGFGIFLLTLIPVMAPAANSEQPYRGDGFLFYGPGRAPGGGTLQQVGVGGEGLFYKGLGVRSEIGYQFPSQGFSYGIGLLSVNGVYHLIHSRRAKLTPFVTGGYTLAFRSGHANLSNFGGGVTWWMVDHVGLKMEIRDYVWPGGNHSPQAMFSFSFR